MPNLENNPQAFPVAYADGKGVNVQSGMSLYDYYVGLAMQGLLSGYQPGETVNITHVAECACTVAATVVEVRNKFI